MVEKRYGERLRGTQLGGETSRVSYCQMVNACGLVWFRRGGECGGCRALPSPEGEDADVRVFSVGALPVALEVPAQDEGVVWERGV